MNAAGIFGQASKASENADRVEYAIFPDEVTSAKGDLYRDNLEKLREELMAFVSPFTEGYIWQKGAFSLRTVAQPDSVPGWKVEDESQADDDSVDSSVPPHLYGSSRFGDNIEDEWFVVFLLLSISVRYPKVSVTVRDSDGYFLLIEAAYALPKWLEPDTSTNRVFLREGALHLIPPKDPTNKRRKIAPVSLTEALEVLQDPAIETRASNKVQSTIQRAVAGFPARAQQNQHRACLLLPLRIAHILNHQPQLVSSAVEAFYDRDVDSMKAASKMAFVLPQGPQTPLVKSSVRFSRAMYAQLRQQEFQAPKVYPSLPPAAHPDHRPAELGMKLAVGFEMLHADRARYAQSEADQEGEAPLQDDPGWRAFKQSLDSRGYFRGLLEGSAEHTGLLAAAATEYRQTEAASRVSNQQYSPAKRMEEIMQIPANPADFSESSLPPDDSEEWLFNGEAELSRAMRDRQSEMEAYEHEQSQHKNAPKEEAPNFDTARVVDTMKRFMESMSSFEGAEVPGELSNDREVNLDMDKFMGELEAALGTSNREENRSEDGLESDLDSDMDWDDEEEVPGGSNRGEAAGPSARLQGARETEGESDSDDSFMGEYEEVMKEQLSSSTLPKSFVRPSEAGEAPRAQDAKSSEASPEASGGGKSAREKGPEEPLNVDVNLMKNLLDSYSAQQGLPGPASNILGMLGLRLPDDEKQPEIGHAKIGPSIGSDDLEAPD